MSIAPAILVPAQYPQALTYVKTRFLTTSQLAKTCSRPIERWFRKLEQSDKWNGRSLSRPAAEFDDQSGSEPRVDIIGIQPGSTDHGRRLVATRAMGPPLVVELPPAFDEHLGLGPGAAAEPFFAVEPFVAQLTVEASDQPVLPRTARRDESRLDCGLSQPAHDLGGGKFSAVVHAE